MNERTITIMLDLLDAACCEAINSPYDVKDNFGSFTSVRTAGGYLMRSLPEGDEKEDVRGKLMDVLEHIHELAKSRDYSGDNLHSAISHAMELSRIINQEF